LALGRDRRCFFLSVPSSTRALIFSFLFWFELWMGQ
jgi:hypothetical protein